MKKINCKISLKIKSLSNPKPDLYWFTIFTMTERHNILQHNMLFINRFSFFPWRKKNISKQNLGIQHQTSSRLKNQIINISFCLLQYLAKLGINFFFDSCNLHVGPICCCQFLFKFYGQSYSQIQNFSLSLKTISIKTFWTKIDLYIDIF